MKWLSWILHRSRAEKQLDSELQFHIEQEVAGNVAAGMSPDDLDPADFAIAVEPIFQRAGGALHLALDDGPVNLFDGALAELLGEACGGLAGASEEQHAGDRLVEPVDDAEEDVAGLGVLVLQSLAVGLDLVHGGFVGVGAAAVGAVCPDR